MEYLAIYQAFVICILLGVWMGLILRWNDVQNYAKKNRAGRQWHAVGFVTRIAAMLVMFPFILTCPIHEIILYLSIYLWLSWVLYDALCNLLRPYYSVPGNLLQRFFYSGSKKSGTTSFIDRTFSDYLPFMKMGYTLLVICYTLFMIIQ